MITPTVVTVVRIKNRPATHFSRARAAKRLRRFARQEAVNWTLVELIVFAVLAALSVLPMLHAIAALRLL